MPTSPNMGLSILTPGVTTGPGWATSLESDKLLLDQHTHVAGQGLQVPSAGVNVNANLPLNNFALTSGSYLSLQAQANLQSGILLSAVQQSGGNLYWNNSTGVPVRLTSGNAIDSSSIGGITGMGGTTAAWTYSSALTTFIGTADANKSAAIDVGAATLRETNVALAKGITLKSPTALAADYTLTLPSVAPPSSGNNLLTFGPNGGAGTFGGPVQQNVMLSGMLTVSGFMTASGIMLPKLDVAGAPAPLPSQVTLYQDSITAKIHAKSSATAAYPLYMNVANTTLPMAAFNTTETIVAGGRIGGTNGPLTNFRVPANALVVGSVLRFKVFGTCTTTAANATTLHILGGPNGTTADTNLTSAGAGPTINAGTTGTNIPFAIEVLATVGVIGASAKFTEIGCTILSNTTTGISGVQTNVSSQTNSTTFDSTSANYFELTMSSPASTTTYTIQSATAELI